MKKQKIIVLGKGGMLGLMVYDYLKRNNDFEVIGTERKLNDTVNFDVIDFNNNSKNFDFLKDADFIINCIGIIKPHCKDDDAVGVVNAIQINALFPHKLANFLEGSKTKVIQIATDCVYSGSKGKYLENSLHDALDVYGKTKSLGEVISNNLLNIRCSIIGPEYKNKLSLLEWFLNQDKDCELNGYDNHLWNGVTTLQYAKLCEKIILEDIFDDLIKTSHVLHFLPNKTVTKYELLNIFNEVFKKNHIINSTQAPVAIDRTLDSNFKVFDEIYPKMEMKAALTELSNYMVEIKGLNA